MMDAGELREMPLWVEAPMTRWRITEVRDWPRLNVHLVVDTTARVVVEAIEQAAARQGIQLERLAEDEAP
jgi:hypothetical protein